MATIKSYADLSQSKFLAEILPLETTDMCYVATHLDENDNLCYSTTPIILQERVAKFKTGVPCWSLAALLGVLPKIVNNETLFIETSAALWHIGYRNIFTARADNPVDACYELIIKLNEFKLL